MGGIIKGCGREIHDELIKLEQTKDIVAIEKFTERVYEWMPKMEAAKIVLTNPRARAAFIAFLRSTESTNDFGFLLCAAQKTKENLKDIEIKSILQQYERPAFETIEPSIVSFDENLRCLLSGEREYPREDIIKILEDTKNETIVLLLLDSFPDFVHSEYFRKWRIEEARLTIAMANATSQTDVTIPEIQVLHPSVNNNSLKQAQAYISSAPIISPVISVESADGPRFITPSEAIAMGPFSSSTSSSNNHDINQLVIAPSRQIGGPTFRRMLSRRTSSLVRGDSITPPEEAVLQAFEHIDYLEVSRIMKSGSWLLTFISAVESIPICVTISTASKERIGFPLIYVNKHFESTTGYTRNEILGANCKFLQRDGSGHRGAEADSIQRLSYALRNATSIKVAITNFRSDGSPFRNLLAIKPVFDLNGEYKYVIGVQFDLSSNGATASTLKLADELITMLPSYVL